LKEVYLLQKFFVYNNEFVANIYIIVEVDRDIS